MGYEPSTPRQLLPIHPDPWHIYTQAELEAYQVAARHIWAVHHLMCMISICVEARNRQLTRHAYPGQPSTRTRPPIRPCCCQYIVINTPDGYVVLAKRVDWPLELGIMLGPDVGHQLETHLLGPTRCPVISLFQISRKCPHHGDGELLWNAWQR